MCNGHDVAELLKVNYRLDVIVPFKVLGSPDLYQHAPFSTFCIVEIYSHLQIDIDHSMKIVKPSNDYNVVERFWNHTLYIVLLLIHYSIILYNVCLLPNYHQLHIPKKKKKTS